MASTYNSYSELWTRIVFFVCSRSDPTTPEGTGFFIHRELPSGKVRGYAVTCAHNVINLHESETLLRFRTKDSQLVATPIEGHWAFPLEDVDLAVMPVTPRIPIVGTPLELSTEAVGYEPRLGGKVLTVGLLSKNKLMAEFGVPMVRSSTIGAVGIPLRHGSGDVYHMNGHLLDSRSEAGASGSPVFSVARFTNLHDPVSLPGWPPRLTSTDPTPRVELRNSHYEYHLYGMLVAHNEEARVSVVMPVESIRQGLDRVDHMVDHPDAEPLLPVNAMIGRLHTTITSMEPIDEEE